MGLISSLLILDNAQNSPMETATKILKTRVRAIAESASARLFPADNLCHRIAVETAEAGEKKL